MDYSIQGIDIYIWNFVRIWSKNLWAGTISYFGMATSNWMQERWNQLTISESECYVVQSGLRLCRLFVLKIVVWWCQSWVGFGIFFFIYRSFFFLFLVQIELNGLESALFPSFIPNLLQLDTHERTKSRSKRRTNRIAWIELLTCQWNVTFASYSVICNMCLLIDATFVWFFKSQISIFLLFFHWAHTASWDKDKPGPWESFCLT